MKPITLKMTAFGPYKTCEEIQFDTLHQYGLFAITGKTGAGKTTIFDAICFALYGSASGEDRNDQMMLRSDFADDTLPTRVELVFELRGKQYRIVRQPGHIKAGQKTITGKEFLLTEVTKDGEIPLTKRAMVSDVNDKIIELIGLSKAQFSQIVMLPQGEFRKLLTSDSINKEAILQKLFNTERFALVAQQAKEQQQQLNKEREDFEVQLQQQVKILKKNLPSSEGIQQIEALNIFQIEEAVKEEMSSLTERQQQADNNYKEAVESEHEIYVQLQRQRQQNEDLQVQQQRIKQYDQYEQQLEQMTMLKEHLKKAQQAQQLQPFFMHKDRAEKAYVEAQQQAETAVKQQVAQQQQQAQLQIQEQMLSTRKDTHEQLEQRMREYNYQLPIIEKIATQQQQLQKMIMQRDESHKIFIQAEQDLDQAQQQLIQLEEQEDTINYEVVLLQLRQQQQMMDKQRQYRQQLTDITQQITQAEITQQQMKQQVAKVKKQFLHYEAAQIAHHLHEGDNCPVCGNKVKESLMSLAQEEAVSITQYEAVQEKSEVINNQLTTLQLQRTQINEQLIENQQQVVIDDDIESKISHAAQGLEQQQQNILATKEQRQKVAQCQTAWQTQQAQYNELITKTQHLQSEQQTLEAQLTDYQQQVPIHTMLVNIRKELQQGEKQLQQWNQEILAFNEEKGQIEQAVTRAEENVRHKQQLQKTMAKQYEDAQQEVQQALQQQGLSVADYKHALTSDQEMQEWQTTITSYEEARNLLSKQIEEATQSLQGATYEEIAPIEASLHMQKQVKESCYEQLHQVIQAVKMCEQSLEDLQAVHRAMAHIETKYQAAKHLDDMLRGQGDNTKRLSFERYVQMYYFDQIIEAANLRLQHLANQQYRLLRSDKLARNKAQSGLTIDVYDVYTDQIRDVKTLSGGEKFNASLSLALGMADVIQQFKGNIQIDMMFIDEGFGSLDDASLTKAIDTLIELQQSGRTIGVISHVEELKNAMPAILQVHKNAEGYSTTQIIIK